MKKVLLVALFAVLFIVGCSQTEEKAKEDSKQQDVKQVSAEQKNEYPNAQLLADVAWLNDHLEDENLFIIDARLEGYDEGHIPGAVSVHTDDVTDINNEIEGFIIDESTFTQLLQKAGLNQDQTVVVYDGGDAAKASRIFYTLEYYGFKDQVKVLNGGFPAWLAAGYESSIETKELAQGNFVAKADEKLLSTREEIEAQLEAEDVVFLDTRAIDEYTGENKRHNKNGGHIPGAIHQEWTTALTENEQGVTVFLSYEELKKNYEAHGLAKDQTIVPYCQTNVRGAHTYFTLRLLGYEDVRPYEGSWAEWGNAEGTKIEL